MIGNTPGKAAWTTALAMGLAFIPSAIKAQQSPTPLDPARNPDSLAAPPAIHLTEQFIWTQGDAAALRPSYQSTVRGQNDKIEPHYFRAHFTVAILPKDATLYIAGPRSATVFLNGSKVLDVPNNPSEGRGFHVKTASVAAALRVGENVIAIEEVRGHSSLHTGAAPTINQVTYGEVLAAKIVPRAIAEDARPLLVSDNSWRSTLDAPANWSDPTFDDSSWKPVQSLGVLGSRSDFMQWNADAGLYDWPGYTGIRSALRTFTLKPAAAQDSSPTDHVIDFGREVNGRVHLVSSSSQAITVDTSYGESSQEALVHPFLGVRSVTIPPHGEAYGPKSAFRYVRLTFATEAAADSVHADVQGIAYPVNYLGSFESSDPLLNRIWETGAYTAHLCMQDDIWDAPKRDRGRWIGDLDVSGRVISDVFADKPLMESTLTALIDDSHTPIDRDVNTLAGYSASWVTELADFYRHSGDQAYLKSMQPKLVDLLHFMSEELNSDALFTNPGKHKVYVDWAEDLSSDTPNARAATHLEFIRGFEQGVWLLDQLGDSADAATYRNLVARMQSAAQHSLLDPATNTFGTLWQTNSMAVLSGSATPDQRHEIWTRLLSQIVPEMSQQGNPKPPKTITPYYGNYVLDAMAQLNHRPEALTWIRQYWGGMLEEGATSFWEGYDPRWPKQDFHAHLQADGKEGYYTSLAHGWAAGPTAWLMQQVLGIQSTGPGFSSVTIRPDLAGLQFARGAEPTPRGLIHIDATPLRIRVTLPSQTTATVLLPFPPRAGKILQNGKAVPAAPVEDGVRSSIVLSAAGDYTFTSNGESK